VRPLLVETLSALTRSPDKDEGCNYCILCDAWRNRSFMSASRAFVYCFECHAADTSQRREEDPLNEWLTAAGSGAQRRERTRGLREELNDAERFALVRLLFQRWQDPSPVQDPFWRGLVLTFLLGWNRATLENLTNGTYRFLLEGDAMPEDRRGLAAGTLVLCSNSSNPPHFNNGTVPQEVYMYREAVLAFYAKLRSLLAAVLLGHLSVDASAQPQVAALVASLQRREDWATVREPQLAEIYEVYEAETEEAHDALMAALEDPAVLKMFGERLRSNMCDDKGQLGIAHHLSAKEAEAKAVELLDVSRGRCDMTGMLLVVKPGAREYHKVPSFNRGSRSGAHGGLNLTVCAILVNTCAGDKLMEDDGMTATRLLHEVLEPGLDTIGFIQRWQLDWVGVAALQLGDILLAL
jgi:hypothetical protein